MILLAEESIVLNNFMSTIQGLNYCVSKIQVFVLDHIQYLREMYELEGLDFTIIEIIVFGSRVTGNPRRKSDLDIKIIYKGPAREDDLFNALHRKGELLYIDDIKVDFWPERI